MIVDCAVYRDGVRLTGDRTPESVAKELSTPPPDEHEPGGADHDPDEGGSPVPREFGWVGLANPLSSELAQVRRALHTPPPTHAEAPAPPRPPHAGGPRGTPAAGPPSAPPPRAPPGGGVWGGTRPWGAASAACASRGVTVRAGGGRATS